MVDWTNSTVLVTGGTGSFGKQFIRTMLDEYHPAKIIVFSRDELKQHEMREAGFNHESMRYFIGDVRDVERLKRAFNGVDIVVHAAALKQVPVCEYNPMEAVKTNILGSANVIDAALDQGVKKVLALSTDKAVNPVNLYGATKLSAEKLFIQSNSYAGGMLTRFSCVRYGNVVGSRGSVVHVFLHQRDSGKLTLTDDRMTRFWISLDQGVRFVINAIEVMQGGEVFVPKLPSMKVTDLATAIAPEATISTIGIRQGEKLHELMIGEDEARSTIDMGSMYVVQPAQSSWFGGDWASRGKQVPEGFVYASNTNGEWLTIPEIQQIIKPFEMAYSGLGD